MKREVTKRKAVRTCSSQLGVDNPMRSEQVQHQAKRSYTLKFGEEHPLQSGTARDKFRKTCLQRFGVDNPMKADSVKAKFKRTCSERFGVDHPAKCPRIQEKMQKSAFNRKEFKTPSGHTWFLQGNEPFVAPILIDQYGEENVTVRWEELLSIFYIDEEDKQHRYFCDSFIKDRAVIVEVKSPYIAGKDMEKVEAIKKASALFFCSS